jgi:hypothetical protein
MRNNEEGGAVECIIGHKNVISTIWLWAIIQDKWFCFFNIKYQVFGEVGMVKLKKIQETFQPKTMAALLWILVATT